jgi:hypothetical protein
MYYAADDIAEKEKDFCCFAFNNCASREGEGSIIYLPQTRSFLLRSGGGSCSDGRYFDMTYCPFCGNMLPADLTDILTRIVYDKLKLRDFDDPNLPAEFRSDAWWKSRGL